MTIDVIIPTYKPGRSFLKLLERIYRQTILPNQVIIVNTEEKFFPEQIAEQFPELEVTHIPKDAFDHGGTRKMAADMSHADLMVFMTQDALPANDRLLEKLAESFKDESVGAAYARQLPASDCGVIERHVRLFNYPKESSVKSKADIPALGIKTFFCSDVCAAYKKSIYRELGGFAERAIFNEDMILAGHMILAGYKVAYQAQAEVIHSHNYTCRQQFHRNFDLAVSQEQHPELFKTISSEKEGMKMVKQTAGYLLRIRKPWLIWKLCVESGFKLLGFKMGQRYRRLSDKTIQKCTMNQEYWDS